MAVVTVPGRHRDEAVDLQDRQERLVEGVGGHRRRRQHRDLRLDAGIEHEVAPGDLPDGLDDLADVGILVIGGDRRLLARLAGAATRQTLPVYPP